MLSAKTVAQKPSGSVSPALSHTGAVAWAVAPSADGLRERSWPGRQAVARTVATMAATIGGMSPWSVTMRLARSACVIGKRPELESVRSEEGDPKPAAARVQGDVGRRGAQRA